MAGPLALAQFAEEDIDRFVAASRTERTGRLRYLRAELTKLRADKGRDKSDAKKAADALQAEIESLEHPLRPYYTKLDLETAKIGDVGFIDDRVQLFQILDADTALVEHVWYSSRAVGMVNVRGDRHSRLLWLDKHVTSKYADEDWMPLVGIFSLTGTKSYDTKAGQRTVPVLEKVDLGKHADRFTRKDELRNWTAKSGHKTEAIYVRHIGSRMTLMNLDGKTVEVSLNTLVDVDREYVRSMD
jgi:hypothetical protein